MDERFGPGFDIEYVGIGRYAADIKQAPLEVAIVVRISPQVLLFVLTYGFPRRMCRASSGLLTVITQVTFRKYTTLRTFVTRRATLEAEQCFQGCCESFGKRRFPWKDKQPLITENHSGEAPGRQGIREPSTDGGRREHGVA